MNNVKLINLKTSYLWTSSVVLTPAQHKVILKETEKHIHMTQWQHNCFRSSSMS